MKKDSNTDTTEKASARVLTVKRFLDSKGIGSKRRCIQWNHDCHRETIEQDYWSPLFTACLEEKIYNSIGSFQGLKKFDALFGWAFSLNNINIWDRSCFLNSFLDGTFSNDVDCSFKIGEQEFSCLWRLVVQLFMAFSSRMNLSRTFRFVRKNAITNF